MAAIPFGSGEIKELGLRSSAVMATEGTDVPDRGGNAADDRVTEMLEETKSDPGRNGAMQEDDTMPEIESIKHE